MSWCRNAYRHKQNRAYHIFYLNINWIMSVTAVARRCVDHLYIYHNPKTLEAFDFVYISVGFFSLSHYV